jgi:hypothetical protein
MLRKCEILMHMCMNKCVMFMKIWLSSNFFRFSPLSLIKKWSRWEQPQCHQFFLRLMAQQSLPCLTESGKHTHTHTHTHSQQFPNAHRPSDHSTLYTLHFLHFTLYTLHFTLYTLHFTLCTLHFNNVHFTL